MATQIIDVNASDEMGAIARRGAYALGITGITAANPAVITLANSFVAGDLIAISGVEGMTEINDRYVTIASRTASAITTDLDTSSGFTAFSLGAGIGDTTLITPSATPSHVRLYYTDSGTTKRQLMDALQRLREYMIEDNLGV